MKAEDFMASALKEDQSGELRDDRSSRYESKRLPLSETSVLWQATRPREAAAAGSDVSWADGFPGADSFRGFAAGAEGFALQGITNRVIWPPKAS